jgi:hypothetical protein
MVAQQYIQGETNGVINIQRPGKHQFSKKSSIKKSSYEAGIYILHSAFLVISSTA